MLAFPQILQSNIGCSHLHHLHHLHHHHQQQQRFTSSHDFTSLVFSDNSETTTKSSGLRSRDLKGFDENNITVPHTKYHLQTPLHIVYFQLIFVTVIVYINLNAYIINIFPIYPLISSHIFGEISGVFFEVPSATRGCRLSSRAGLSRPRSTASTFLMSWMSLSLMSLML